MAAAMLVASLPAMAMPTFNVNAAPTMTVNAVKFEGSYDNTQILYPDFENNAVKKTQESVDVASPLKLEKYYGMVSSATNVWDTNIMYYEQLDGTTVSGPVAGKELQAAVSGDKKDYEDSTGTVSKIATTSKGMIQITFDGSKLATYKSNLQKGTAAGSIKFYPFDLVDSSDNAIAAFEIQVGETLVSGKSTKIQHVATPDNTIQDAEIRIESNGNATLLAISENDRKVNMKDQDIEVSEVYVSGIAYPVRKFDDKALKKGTMKTIKAANIKNLGTGALRNCKKLRKVRMGSSKMRKIHSNAFYDCGKLKNIKINCKNLKSVGSKAFMKLKKNCQISIKAGKSKYNKVVKMIKKSGTDQVKFKRV
jgi:hypothetical protein